MRTVWKDILTITNTAGIAGIVFYGYYSDYNASVIVSLATFILAMIIYLFFQTVWRKGQRRN